MIQDIRGLTGRGRTSEEHLGLKHGTSWHEFQTNACSFYAHIHIHRERGRERERRRERERYACCFGLALVFLLVWSVSCLLRPMPQLTIFGGRNGILLLMALQDFPQRAHKSLTTCLASLRSPLAGIHIAGRPRRGRLAASGASPSQPEQRIPKVGPVPTKY